MDPIIAFAAIAAALAIGAMSPGPSFVVVARISVGASRAAGLAAALGMGIGGLVFGSLALLGLQAVLAQVDWLYLGLKLLGGGYLLHLGIRLWRSAATPLVLQGADDRPDGLGRPFWQGLATQLSNPKTAVAYAGIFAALLPPDPPLWLALGLLPLILAIETGWYAVVAVAFSSGRPRAAYLRSKAWIDRTAGALLAALGIKLILETGQPA